VKVVFMQFYDMDTLTTAQDAPTNPIVVAMRTIIGKPLRETPFSPSPLAAWLNGTFTKVDDGDLTAEFTVHREMTNPLGNLHGGAAAAIADELMGAAVYSTASERVYVTVNLHIDYLGHTKQNEVVTGHARVVRRGRTIMHVEFHLHSKSGKLLAHATCNMVAIEAQLPKF